MTLPLTPGPVTVNGGKGVAGGGTLVGAEFRTGGPKPGGGVTFVGGGMTGPGVGVRLGPGTGGAAVEAASPPLRDTVEATTSSARRHWEYPWLGIEVRSLAGPVGIGRGATVSGARPRATGASGSRAGVNEAGWTLLSRSGVRAMAWGRPSVATGASVGGACGEAGFEVAMAMGLPSSC